ncbi:MAG: hypothetical protein HUK03_09365, partial [Bacteroidaceae bacterium]|nr:hypothetical protein [Bacteroidaceae bacterium]
FFAIYETKHVDKQTGEEVIKRTFNTIPLNEVISRMKQGLSPAPEDSMGNAPKYVLSPGDMVYVPKAGEDTSNLTPQTLDHTRLYRMVSASRYQCHFLKWENASIIVDSVEYQALNKMERAITGEMIKEVCIPVKVNRLGTIEKIG